MDNSLLFTKMDSEINFAQVQMPPPSEAADEGMTEFTEDTEPTISGSEEPDTSDAETESTRSATPAASTLLCQPVCRPVKRQSLSPYMSRRTAERIRNDKAGIVAHQDRVAKLFQLRDDRIALAEKQGKGSLRERFPSEMSEDDERSVVVRNYADYISGKTAPMGVNRLAGSSQKQSFHRRPRDQDIDEDDDEPTPTRPLKRLKQEVKDDDDSSDALPNEDELSKSGVVAGMAITRGFYDARFARPEPKASVNSMWKVIGGEWTRILLLSASTGSQKRMSECAGSEIGRKRAKVE